MKHELRKEGHTEMRMKSQGKVAWSYQGGLPGVRGF